MITDLPPNVVSEVTVNGTNGKRASSSLSDVAETGHGIGLVPGNSRRFDIDDALWNIRAKFTVYLENGGRALNEALGIGRILDRIKRGIRSGARGFPDTTWEAWCWRAHAANELPFARRQADHYIQLWNHRGEITFEDDAASLRAGIAIIRGDSDGKTKRERWRAVYRAPPGHRESSADANRSGEAIHLSTKGRVRVTWSLVDPATPPKAETTADQHDARFRSSALCGSANRTQDDDTEARDGHRPMESTSTESTITASKIGDVAHAHDAVQAAAKALTLSLTDPEMARKINQWLEKCAAVKQSRDRKGAVARGEGGEGRRGEGNREQGNKGTRDRGIEGTRSEPGAQAMGQTKPQPCKGADSTGGQAASGTQRDRLKPPAPYGSRKRC